MTKSHSEIRLPNGYKIVIGPVAVSIQRYNGSNIGWTWVKDFKTREQAENWLLGK